MELLDKDGTKIYIDGPSYLNDYDLLKLNKIPESSTAKTKKGFKFLYNTILRDLQNISEETMQDKESAEAETFFVKKVMYFDGQGRLIKKSIEMDKNRFFKYIEDKFVSTIVEHKLIKDGGRIVLGYSGGSDCSILLDLLIKNKENLPRFNLTAVTVGSLAGTNKKEFIVKFCKQRGVNNIFVEDEEIAKRFNLNCNLDRAIDKVLSSDKQLAINFIQHMIKIMLEEVARRESCNKIMLGLERETMITSLLSFYLSGKPLLGLYKKSDGEFTYIFPLMSLLKKEEYIYLQEKMNDYFSLSAEDVKNSKLDRLHSSDWRGSLMLLAGHLLDLFPGIDFYLENSFREIHKFYCPIIRLKKCFNCNGSYILLEDKGNLCGVCDILNNLNLITKNEFS